MKQLSKNWALIVLLLLIGQQALSYDFEVNGIYYGYDISTQTAYVTSGDNKYSGTIDIPMSVTYNGRSLNVTAIGYGAFSECKGLVSINMPQSITSIGGQAFKYCRKLTTVNMSDKVTDIGESAFAYCSNLSSIKLPSNITLISGNAFEGCEKLESISIPDNVSEIRESAFQGCKGLKSIVIPKNVNKLSKFAFQGCSGVETIVLEECDNYLSCDAGIFYNHYDAFWGTSPRSIFIGRNIPEMLFYGNGGSEGIDFKNLSILSIGKKVTKLDITNLSLWTSLKTIYSFSENPESVKVSFGTKTYTNTKLYVPIGTKEKYLAADGWKEFFIIEEMDVDKMWNGQSEPPTGDNPQQQKCEKPIIHYSNGKLSFECATDGATCQSTITDTDIASYSENEIQLSVTYNISVYASKAGYDNSDIVTATLCWIDADPKTEGIESGVAQVKANAVLIQSHDGTVSVEGVADGTDITIYDTSGQMVGSTKAHCNYTTIATNLRNGSVAIVRIGDKSLKIIMK